MLHSENIQRLEFILDNANHKPGCILQTQNDINLLRPLIETRLSFSDLRINEIASELGFTDESHMNKLFRKYRGMSPSEFRQNVKHK